MNNTRSNKAVRRQHSVFYSSPQTPDGAVEFYRHMLLQDVSLGIMPIGGRSSRVGFSVTITPANERAEEIIVEGLRSGGFGSYHRDSLADTMYEFFRLLAAELCAADRATYEIVYFEEPETRTFTGFQLVFINEEQLVKKRGQMYQAVPPEVARERQVAELIRLPMEDLLVFKPPAAYERALRDMRASLSELDGMRFPSLALEAMQKNMPYDFKAHERSTKLALLEAVKPIGWNARGSLDGLIMSYYLVHLMIGFERFKVQLRDSMLATLNTGLERIGGKIGFQARIRIDGLPTLSDVDTANHNLNSGTMPFTEVMKCLELR